MSRNVRAAAAALALAGGVYLVGAAPAEASNMGFKLERSFNLERQSATPNRPLRNVYWVSMPLFNGLGDVANTSGPGNPCVGDPTGPATGDGILTATDFLCDVYQARFAPDPRLNAGTMTMTYYDPTNCTPLSRNATISFTGDVVVTGLIDFELQPDAGYEIQVTLASGSASPQNRAVIVGSHDPSFAGTTVFASPTCTGGQTENCCGARARRLMLLNLPYHTMYETSYEILCGLENVDWVDANLNGEPDTCWDDVNGNGLFDAGEPPTGIFDGVRTMSINYWDNTEAENAAITHNVAIVFNALRFTGRSFDLVPGDAYLAEVALGHTPTTFLSPHF